MDSAETALIKPGAPLTSPLQTAISIVAIRPLATKSTSFPRGCGERSHRVAHIAIATIPCMATSRERHVWKQFNKETTETLKTWFPAWPP